MSETASPSTQGPSSQLAEIESRQDRLLSELDRLNGEIELALEGLGVSRDAA